MMKSRILYWITIGVLPCSMWAGSLVDCRVLASNKRTCNPYSSTLIHAKEVQYDSDTQTLIVSKILPQPKPHSIKIISVEDMIEKYVKIEAPIRFSPSLKEKNYTKMIHTLVKEKIEEESKKPEAMAKNTSKALIGIYTVVSGDVLGKISQKFNISTDTILTLNHLKKEDTLHIGQELKIPLEQKMIDAIASAHYQIEQGDTLLSIAHLFDLDPKLLVKYNHLKSSAMIREGKMLLLPLPYVMKAIEKAEKKELAEKKREEEKAKLAKKKQKEEAEKRKSSRVKARISKRKLYLKQKGFGRHKLRVTATAYSSHRHQTDSTPFLAAWNNRLRPGMKIIAVSRDLLTRYGLRNGTRVRIGGLRGYYRVRDKMNKRFRRRIDIYMGVNRRRALRWGRRSVNIYW